MLRGLERSHFTAGCQILIWASPDGDMIERLRLDTVPFPQQKIICFNYSYSCGGAFKELSKRIQASNHDWLPPCFFVGIPLRLVGCSDSESFHFSCDHLPVERMNALESVSKPNTVSHDCCGFGLEVFQS
jgi:hypothetical protein